MRLKSPAIRPPSRSPEKPVVVVVDPYAVSGRVTEIAGNDEAYLASYDVRWRGFPFFHHRIVGLDHWFAGSSAAS